jgi:UDP-N-acetylglucosamine 1-carboxyvinyltransferase
MHKYIINGSYPIKGKIKANGNKNAALPCITATLLSDEPITLHNVPNFEDVQVLFSILEDLGSTVERLGEKLL